MAPKMTRRGIIAGATALVAAGGSVRGGASTSVVYELFTSQSCSSCPPADKLAAELAGRPGVTVITYHVDYWDYLGWKDTLGANAFSQRQYDYAKARGDKDVYTPQVVINGAQHHPGADRAAIIAALEQGVSPGPSLVVEATDELMRITIGAGSANGDVTLWVVPVAASVEVAITKGENAGKIARYRNVARDIVPAGLWSGTPQDFTLPRRSLMSDCCTGCVALLQMDRAGPILASATWGKLA